MALLIYWRPVDGQSLLYDWPRIKVAGRLNTPSAPAPIWAFGIGCPSSNSNIPIPPIANPNPIPIPNRSRWLHSNMANEEPRVRVWQLAHVAIRRIYYFA